ncbi:hypothetical protein ACFOW4_30005 [Micromonospora sp. GCM10011542]|uniref:hypothetical protein n=1 Tax=Micromonospora sp. GCM10011542 TaxID=3317337 RepID=UPI00360C8651
MGRLAGTGSLLGAAALATAAARLLRVPRGRGPGDADGDVPAGWEVVTVDRPPEQVLPNGRWPDPLRRLDGAVEVRVRPAPDDRGTELAARPLVGAQRPGGLAAHLFGDDPGLQVRWTLGQVKQRVESGDEPGRNESSS